jgi:nucleoside-diphosphate-sugar epimerase
MPELPLVVARPSAVIGHTSLGVRPSSSLFWYYRALAALGRGPFSRDTQRDIVPVDYVADALAHLALAPRLRDRTYHVSAGHAAVTMDAVLGCFGAATWRAATPGELGECADVRRLTRTDDEARRLARGISACARFGALGIQRFDNTRLLAEGVPAPPRFTDYLPKCIATTGERAIYDQMIDDA